MNMTRISLSVVLAVAGLATTARGDYTVSTRAFGGGTVRRSAFIPPPPDVFGIVHSESLTNSSDKDLSVELYDEGEQSTFARGVLSIDLEASFGNLGISFFALAHGSPSGSTVVNISRAEASWVDVSTINIPGMPVGASIRMNAHLDIEGQLLASSSGNAQGQAFLDIVDFEAPPSSLPRAPYPQGHWARVFDNGVDTIDDPDPGAIRVSHLMQNGRPYRLGYVLTVVAEVVALDGTAAVAGKFIQSLNWGGIDSVEDFNGELIEGLDDHVRIRIRLFQALRARTDEHPTAGDRTVCAAGAGTEAALRTGYRTDQTGRASSLRRRLDRGGC